jgi:hypothetical protein
MQPDRWAVGGNSNPHVEKRIEKHGAKIRETSRSRRSTHVFRKVDKATVSPKARRTAIKNS